MLLCFDMLLMAVNDVVFFYVVLAQKLPESIKYGLELTDNSEILRSFECTFFSFFSYSFSLFFHLLL